MTSLLPFVFCKVESCWKRRGLTYTHYTAKLSNITFASVWIFGEIFHWFNEFRSLLFPGILKSWKSLLFRSQDNKNMIHTQTDPNYCDRSRVNVRMLTAITIDSCNWQSNSNSFIFSFTSILMHSWWLAKSFQIYFINWSHTICKAQIVTIIQQLAVTIFGMSYIECSRRQRFLFKFLLLLCGCFHWFLVCF